MTPTTRLAAKVAMRNAQVDRRACRSLALIGIRWPREIDRAHDDETIESLRMLTQGVAGVWFVDWTREARP